MDSLTKRFDIRQNGSLLQIFDSLTHKCLDIQCYNHKLATEKRHYYEQMKDADIRNMVVKGVPIWKTWEKEMGLDKQF